MNNFYGIGRLVDEPKLTEFSNGTKRCDFSIAIKRDYVMGGERKTDFFECRAWKGTAETIAKFGSKGRKVAIRASVEQNNFETQNGTKYKAVVFVVDKIEFLETTEKNANTAPTSNSKQQSKVTVPMLDDDGDDDFIPF